ncbi:MAG: hypothetical protein A3E87_07325 [Gammaproteobacteria bacterium RIFCSPHIGHO2_12_FULL_35_23]|nr:MAG: hypothetical protein A3E87_07325 [Gammaproteobacteria bacterium RIFCSPHIGHO2_12_FULL_35_23]
MSEVIINYRLQLKGGSFLNIPCAILSPPPTLHSGTSIPLTIGPSLGEGAWGSIFSLHSSDLIPDIVLKQGVVKKDLEIHIIIEALIFTRLYRFSTALHFKALDQDNLMYFFIMSRIKGVNLQQYFSTQNPNIIERLKILIAILNKLKELHQKSYIHGDLKLENIMIFKNEAGEYEINFIDFQHSYRSNKFATVITEDCYYWTANRTFCESKDAPLAHFTQDLFSLFYCLYIYATGYSYDFIYSIVQYAVAEQNLIKNNPYSINLRSNPIRERRLRYEASYFDGITIDSLLVSVRETLNLITTLYESSIFNLIQLLDPSQLKPMLIMLFPEFSPKIDRLPDDFFSALGLELKTILHNLIHVFISLPWRELLTHDIASIKAELATKTEFSNIFHLLTDETLTLLINLAHHHFFLYDQLIDQQTNTQFEDITYTLLLARNSYVTLSALPDELEACPAAILETFSSISIDAIISARLTRNSNLKPLVEFYKYSTTDDFVELLIAVRGAISVFKDNFEKESASFLAIANFMQLALTNKSDFLVAVYQLTEKLPWFEKNLLLASLGIDTKSVINPDYYFLLELLSPEEFCSQVHRELSDITTMPDFRLGFWAYNPYQNLISKLETLSSLNLPKHAFAYCLAYYLSTTIEELNLTNRNKLKSYLHELIVSLKDPPPVLECRPF